MDRIDRKRQQLATLASRVARRAASRVAVADVMTAQPTCITKDATLLELVKLFHSKEFRHPLVTDAAGNLVGVVSDRDVIRCFGPGRYPEDGVLERITAADIMSTDLVTIAPEAPLEQAIELMCGFGINCLPVVVGGKLLGILTSTDLYVVLEMLLDSLHPTTSATTAKSAMANR